MRIKSVHLDDYKRFTDLRIEDIPSTCRLVVLIGPNGSGKSSLFDAFLLKSQKDPSVQNTSINDDLREYYYKSRKEAEKRTATAHLWPHIRIGFHETEPPQGSWSSAFNIRSPYRNEHQLEVKNLSAVAPASEQQRFARIIEPDRAVSDNYRRLAWKRMFDLDGAAPSTETFGRYRAESLRPLQDAMTALFPDLALQDFGGVTGGGGFRFAKGTTSDFPYQNLSGGEKAAFDLLLDLFVKRQEFENAVYCIDEPEAHAAVAIQGRLLEALLVLLPPQSQLWIATHSIGFVRAAHKRSEEQGDVVFLDFNDHDFDEQVTLTPTTTGRSFWRKTYNTALDDLAALVGPSRIVLCEGNRGDPSEGFDAKCYSELFGETHGDTLFLSRGSASQVERSQDLVGIFEKILEGVEIVRLIDRDDMTEDRRAQQIRESSMRILTRREVENYLYDPQVLLNFFRSNGLTEIPRDIGELLADPVTGDIKPTSQQILIHSRRALDGVPLGNDRKEFALAHLVPALRDTLAVYSELEEDIFGPTTPN